MTTLTDLLMANLIADLHGELRPHIGWGVESGLLVQAFHALAADADWRREVAPDLIDAEAEYPALAADKDWRRPARQAASRAVVLTGSAGAAAERLLAATDTP